MLKHCDKPLNQYQNIFFENSQYIFDLQAFSMDAQGLWNQDYLRFRGNKCGKENLHLYGSFPPPFGLNTVG